MYEQIPVLGLRLIRRISGEYRPADKEEGHPLVSPRDSASTGQTRARRVCRLALPLLHLFYPQFDGWLICIVLERTAGSFHANRVATANDCLSKAACPFPVADRLDLHSVILAETSGEIAAILLKISR